MTETKWLQSSRGLYTAHCSRTMGLLSFEPSDWFLKVTQVDCLGNRKYLRTRLGIMVMRDDVMRQEGEILESLLHWRRKGSYICNRLSQLTHVGEEVSPVQGARTMQNACAVTKMWINLFNQITSIIKSEKSRSASQEEIHLPINQEWLDFLAFHKLDIEY